MKKETKAQLIERAAKIGLTLSMKLKWDEMADAIAIKEKEMNGPKKEKEIEKGDLIALVNRVSDCGCSYVPTGTIARLLRKSGERSARYPNEIKFCNNGCTVWVKDEDIRALTESELVYAEERFSNALGYRYARVD